MGNLKRKEFYNWLLVWHNNWRRQGADWCFCFRKERPWFTRHCQSVLSLSQWNIGLTLVLNYSPKSLLAINFAKASISMSLQKDHLLPCPTKNLIFKIMFCFSNYCFGPISSPSLCFFFSFVRIKLGKGSFIFSFLSLAKLTSETYLIENLYPKKWNHATCQATENDTQERLYRLPL